MTDRWVRVPDLLSRLEDLELPLLSWGVVDGFLSQSDVDAAIQQQLDIDAETPGASFVSTDDYLKRLLDTGLLHKLPDPPSRYRTRLGETLRLLRTLRQLWPPTNLVTPGWWRNSNSLVADYRLRVAPRRYPRRSIGHSEAITELQDMPGWSALYADVLSRIVGPNQLAKFQVEATSSVLSALEFPYLTGRIITAGTGSGKTLAFYLPALLDIAATVGLARQGPHTLALYPRNELLRDQAREALRVVTSLGPLDGAGSRPARIGLLYGNTPDERDLKGQRAVRGWRRHGAGWVCPYFPCPTEGCPGLLIWSDTDREAGVERLVCSLCPFESQRDTLSLTRQSLVQRPPDILFTSTEMLDKQATSPSLAKFLGWKGPNGTRMVLLDEVHTYSGVHGAQVGLMLRRWRYANRQWGVDSPVMVGLSATLRNAGDFFASLTGADPSNVEVIAPAKEDLTPISREYGIVLRGDPVSGAALLSTTIQTAMLVARVLDIQPGIYGSVVFAFADDLDSINRLYDNLRDAEGQLPRGRAAGAVLADLRNPSQAQVSARYREGQSWDLPYRLRRMERPLRVARTSSQDAGVDIAADIITATSSLEVGFNDPRVGAVLQHKAPHDLASFLQRRGRAGRRISMRPITVVVLSDYGRDRIAYQSYEKLLDPEIDARSLPIGNRFVVKMQATHALIDWLSRRTAADARRILSPPRNGPDPKSAKVRDLLRALITDPATQEDLSEHLQRALGLSADEVLAALWEEPRSLMLSVVPTALRRLESKWTPLPNETDPGAIDRTPLPEFMTHALFGSLNTPDVLLELPVSFNDDEAAMPIAQALREAVPGRVSRRYGYAHASHSTWLPVPTAGIGLPLEDIVAKGHSLGTWTTADGDTFLVVRPLVLRLQRPPATIADTSNPQPAWRSAFEIPEGALHHMDVPKPSAWADLIDTCSFALHVGGGPLKVRRMAIGSDGELSLTDGTSRPLHVRYEHNGHPAALGFELDVDAVVITGRLGAGNTAHLVEFSKSPAWRTLAFRRRVIEDPRLDDIANSFQRRWLSDVYLNAFITLGLGGVERPRILEALTGGSWANNLRGFLELAYRSNQTGVQAGRDRTLNTLAALSSDPRIQYVIEEHGRLLATGEPSAADLLDRVFLDTLSGAVLTAVEESLPDAGEADLVVDTEFDMESRAFRIIVSETAIGGLGLLEALHRQYALEPRRFWEAVERACSPTEAEDVDESMTALLGTLVDTSTPTAMAVAAFRSADGIAKMDAALQTLRHEWMEFSGPPSHLLISTLATRLLRPGGSPEIDRVVTNLITAWRDAETRLGVEVDARTLAYHAGQGDLGINIRPLSIDSVFSMLWLRGPVARNQRLEHWQPYRSDVAVERLSVDALAGDRATTIDVTQSDWALRFVAAVETDGRVTLMTPYLRRRLLADAVLEAIATPVDWNGLKVYVRVSSMSHRRGEVRILLSLAEDLQ